MADEGLKVKIGADITEFEKGIASVDKGLNTLQKSSVNTGTTLTNLSRVASDAPFGFIAIQNNLEPLIQGFGSLSTQAGGTGNAIKALAGSLIGPAGLALGFSVVSALVTTAIQKYGSLGAAVDALFGSTSDYTRQLNNLQEVQKNANKSAGDELAKLDVLNKVTTDVTVSYDKRVKAADELLKKYAEYLPQVSKEELLNNQAADAINAAKDAILNKALAAASEKKLAEIAQKRLDLLLEEKNAQEKLRIETESYNKELQNQGKIITGFAGVGAGASSALGLTGASDSLKDIQKELKNTTKDYNALLELGKTFKTEAIATGTVADAAKASKVQIPEAKKGAAELRKLNLAEQKQTNKELEDEIKASAKRQLDIYLAVQAIIRNNLPKVPELPLPNFSDQIAKQQQAASQLVAQGLELQKKAFENLKLEAQSVAEVFSNVFNPVLDQVFANIEAGKPLFEGLGDVVKKFVLNAIKELLKLAAFSAITALFTGGAGTFGSKFLTNFKGGLGGALGAPSLGKLGGGTIPLSVSGQFALRGTDLVASVAQSNQRIGRVG